LARDNRRFGKKDQRKNRSTVATPTNAAPDTPPKVSPTNSWWKSKRWLGTLAAIVVSAAGSLAFLFFYEKYSAPLSRHSDVVVAAIAGFGDRKAIEIPVVLIPQAESPSVNSDKQFDMFQRVSGDASSPRRGGPT
jgi:hypothetical protein